MPPKPRASGLNKPAGTQQTLANAPQKRKQAKNIEENTHEDSEPETIAPPLKKQKMTLATTTTTTAKKKSTATKKKKPEKLPELIEIVDEDEDEDGAEASQPGEEEQEEQDIPTLADDEVVQSVGLVRNGQAKDVKTMFSKNIESVKMKQKGGGTVAKEGHWCNECL